MIQHNYQSQYLVTVDDEQSSVNVYEYEKCKFEEAFLVIKPSKILSIFIGKSCFCPMTEYALTVNLLISMVILFY